MTSFVSWWCPSCRLPQLEHDRPCTSCGHKPEDNWRCRCGNITKEFECPECGLDLQKKVKSEKLDTRLSQIAPDGRTVYDRLQKFIRYTAHKQNIPKEVVEEGWSMALEKLVNAIDQFDPNKGEFLHWAMAVVRSQLNEAARRDATENVRIELSIDGDVSRDGEGEETEYLETIGDVLIGDALGIDWLVQVEERRETNTRMIGIAERVFGTYGGWSGDRYVEDKSVFGACVAAFEKVDGKDKWMAEVSDATGIPGYTIKRMKNKVRAAWQRWQEERKVM